MSTMKQEAGDSSQNQQAGQIVNNIINIALAPLDEMAEAVLLSAFGGVPDETLELVRQNQQSFKEVLVVELKKVLEQVTELQSLVSSPDFQYISKQALLSASRSDDVDLHKNLSNLVAQRMVHDKSDIKKIVFNEAIQTVSKLTTNQLKILSLCFLGKNVIWNGITKVEELNAVFEKYFLPFLNVNLTNSQFQYLEYAGCSNTSGIGGKDYFIQMIKRRYPMAISKGLEKDGIENLEVFNLIENDGLIKMPHSNLEGMKEQLQVEGLNEEQMQPHVAMFNRIIGNRLVNADAEIPTLFSSGEKIKETYEWFGTMNLTAVGVALAITYVEEVTGEKWNVDLWIN